MQVRSTLRESKSIWITDITTWFNEIVDSWRKYYENHGENRFSSNLQPCLISYSWQSSNSTHKVQSFHTCQIPRRGRLIKSICKSEFKLTCLSTLLWGFINQEGNSKCNWCWHGWVILIMILINTLCPKTRKVWTMWIFRNKILEDKNI